LSTVILILAKEAAFAIASSNPPILSTSPIFYASEPVQLPCAIASTQKSFDPQLWVTNVL
jgi:hypothetical protein